MKRVVPLLIVACGGNPPPPPAPPAPVEQKATRVPIETNEEKPRLRSDAFSSNASPSAPLCEENAIGPGGSARGPKVAFIDGAATAMPESAVTTVGIPWGSMVTIVIAAAIAGVVAGYFPGRRAAKLDVLRAINTE